MRRRQHVVAKQTVNFRAPKTTITSATTRNQLHNITTNISRRTANPHNGTLHNSKVTEMCQKRSHAITQQHRRHGTGGLQPGVILKGESHSHCRKPDGIHGNGVPIVKVFKNTRLQGFAYTIYNLTILLGVISQILLGVIPQVPRRSAPELGPRHQFKLGSPAFPLFLCNETTTAAAPKLTKGVHFPEIKAENVVS